jgi:hypothetical protein
VRVGARAGAHATSGRVDVRWPSDGSTQGTIARAAPDTVGAVIAGDITVVAPFERRQRLALADSMHTRVVARWVDGEPAAVERETTVGCERDVAVAVPTEGDVVLRPEYQRFETAMRAPCARTSQGDDRERAAAADLDGVGGRGGTRIAARVVPAASVMRVPLVPWLLGAAIVVALGELVTRRRRSPD